jgi:3-phosphoshikimate 1-carboxyvinyltransferase
MTLRLLEKSSVDVVQSTDREWIVKRCVPSVTDAVVEPDLSNAFAFFCAALITRGSCTVADFPTASVQPTDKVQEIVEAFGGQFRQSGNAIGVSATGELQGIDLDLGEVGELVPNVAAMAAVATAPSRIRGVAHLRGHETDRLAALVEELSQLGCDISETSDGLAINPRPLIGGVFHTYHDHRMATTGALVGLVTPGIYVENISTTRKTLPDFPALWRQMLDIG